LDGLGDLSNIASENATRPALEAGRNIFTIVLDGGNAAIHSVFQVSM
jgi:hypothetical protein